MGYSIPLGKTITPPAITSISPVSMNLAVAIDVTSKVVSLSIANIVLSIGGVNKSISVSSNELSTVAVTVDLAALETVIKSHIDASGNVI